MRTRRRWLTVASLSGVLLAGTAVEIAAQNQMVAGTITPPDQCVPATEDAVLCSGGRFEFDDPRLTGDYEAATTVATGSGADFIVGWIRHGDVRVTNAEGSWSGQTLWAFVTPPEEPIFAGGHWVLYGEGGYESLTAYVGEDQTLHVKGEAWPVRGFILESELEAPEPPAD